MAFGIDLCSFFTKQMVAEQIFGSFLDSVSAGKNKIVNNSDFFYSYCKGETVTTNNTYAQIPAANTHYTWVCHSEQRALNCSSSASIFKVLINCLVANMLWDNNLRHFFWGGVKSTYNSQCFGLTSQHSWITEISSPLLPWSSNVCSGDPRTNRKPPPVATWIVWP